MGQQGLFRDNLMAPWARSPPPPGNPSNNPFKNRLRKPEFKAFFKGASNPYYAPRMGAPSLPPTLYPHTHNRLHLGHIQASGISCRFAGTFSLRAILGCPT